MIRIVTVDREYGSGGGVIARRLAAERSWKLWDHELTEEIARQAKCETKTVEKLEERNDPLYYRFLKSFVRGGFEGSNLEYSLDLLDADLLFQITQRVIRRAASEGNCVIVGRGSAYFLQDLPDALHAFVYASRTAKIRRLCAKGQSTANAQQLIDTVDRDRAAFVKHHYNRCWPDRQLFHLMVNSTAGDDLALRLMNQAVDLYSSGENSSVSMNEAATRA